MTWGWLDSTTQRWVRISGRRIDLSLEYWLQAPVGASDTIAGRRLATEAARLGATITTEVEVAGLLSMAELDAPGSPATNWHQRSATSTNRPAALTCP